MPSSIYTLAAHPHRQKEVPGGQSSVECQVVPRREFLIENRLMISLNM